MTARLRNFWHMFGRRGNAEPQVERTTITERPTHAVAPAVEIAPNDPVIAYFQSVAGAVDIDKLELQSPAVQALKAAGVKLAVPLVSQGELIGLLNLGPRLSEQDYSTDDRGLLSNLATQAAPALRVAQLVRQQQAEIQVRERIEQELRVARLIQQTLLPKETPALAGWRVAQYYQPARAVGGDFYDFLYLPDGRLGVVVGDVTDKGVPAALVMATTRSILRGAATRLSSPGQVLERANELLCPDIPPNMFVTCLYAILDPADGRLEYANAGHDLPYLRRHDGSVEELRARGMPLGLMPGMHYEEKETSLAPGDNVLFYSDGIVEAHDPQYEMFSF
ncbi:MAG TPA: PP2C family protein-serine/threonine phosphatase, partial [Herpetosiphonaceae bacterium]|nr:PP2C family protein-serine/threonine phosphatase [Herpetosiphonaceae bacterium]